MRVVAIIAAAGSGERFGRPGGKQLATLAGATVVEHAARPILACGRVDGVVVVTREEDVPAFLQLFADAPKVIGVVAGGETRQDSVRAGLAAVPPSAEVVVVHDGARPLVTAEAVEAVLEALGPGVDAAVVGHPSVDTVKSVDHDGFVVKTEDRQRLWLVQTPQAFRVDALSAALERAAEAGTVATDEAALIESAGGRVRVVAGSRDNIKVTVPEDLAVAEALLMRRAEADEQRRSS